MSDDSIQFENRAWVSRLQGIMSVINSDQPREGVSELQSFHEKILACADVHSQMGMLEDFFLLGTQWIARRKIGILQLKRGGIGKTIRNDHGSPCQLTPGHPWLYHP